MKQKIFVAIWFATGLCSAKAAVIVDFTGDFVVSNWTQSPGPGSIITINAPTSVSLVSGNQGGSTGSSSTLFTITAPYAGLLAFSWNYSNVDPFGASADPFIFSVGGVVQLRVNTGGKVQAGSLSVPVSIGQLISFNASSLDNIFGAATTTISGFTFTTTSAIPEPGAALPLAALFGFGFLYRSRRGMQ